MEVNLLRILPIAFFIVTLASCTPAATPAPQLTPITIQLSWTNQAEFAGLYAADQLGYFADEGFRVSFLEGGSEVDFIAPVVDGRAQFGIAQPADVILARADGAPVRSVDQTLQAMMTRVGIDEHQYETEYLPSDIALFASGNPPVWEVRRRFCARGTAIRL